MVNNQGVHGIGSSIPLILKLAMVNGKWMDVLQHSQVDSNMQVCVNVFSEYKLIVSHCCLSWNHRHALSNCKSCVAKEWSSYLCNGTSLQEKKKL